MKGLGSLWGIAWSAALMPSLVRYVATLAARSRLARKALTRRRVRPVQGPCLIPLLSALVLAYSPAAFAGPTPCQGVGGPDVTCTGDQSNGVIGGVDFPLNTTTSLTIKDLTKNISVAKSGAAYGIQWGLASGFPQPNMDLLFSSADFSSIARSTSGGFAAGIDVESIGSPSGRTGRSVILDVNGSASATGTGGAAVYGLVTGNTGANGGLLDITLGPPPKSDLIAANGVLSGSGDRTSGIAATGRGGNGANGDSGGVISPGNDGGNGGSGATVNVNVTGGNWNITSNGFTSPGVLLQSYGGNGGNGGSSFCCNGGFGGKGGEGGTVSFESSSGQVTIRTGQNDQASPGLLLLSQAGSGGTGGSSDLFGEGGNGGAGGGGGPITVLANRLDITTDSNSIYSPGVAAYSLGGTGGNGGNGGAFNSGSADGGGTGQSGPVTVTVQAGNIQTAAANSAGIIAQSIAGHAGTGGGGTRHAPPTSAAAGGSAGAGGTVDVTNGATIRTNSDQSVALFAQSAGGGGGNGGSGFGIFYSAGGNGGNGGDGGQVIVNNTGSLTTSGADSEGIFAQSVGGARR